MVLVGILLLVMLLSSVLALSACMLSGQRTLEPERFEGMKVEMGSHWSGTTFGGKYTSVVPHCSFEPEDLEEFQVVRF